MRPPRSKAAARPAHIRCQRRGRETRPWRRRFLVDVKL
jgi:hypothetical protein